MGDQQDRVAAAGDKLMGSVRKTADKVIGDEQTEAKGTIDQGKGGLSEGIADVKNKASDLAERAKYWAVRQYLSSNDTTAPVTKFGALARSLILVMGLKAPLPWARRRVSSSLALAKSLRR